VYNFWRELSPPPPHQPIPHLDWGLEKGRGDNVEKGIEGEGGIPRKWRRLGRLRRYKGLTEAYLKQEKNRFL
jgi:hypothetical protein